MAIFWRRFCLFLGVLLVGGGCNVLSLPFFIFGPEPKYPPEYHPLASEDKEKEVKVVILTYGGLQTNPEFLQSDRELSFLLARHLSELCKYNEEKVTVINPRRVEEYKSANPDWHYQNLDVASIGEHFGADYVVYIEIGSLSLYKPGSGDHLYRGQAHLTLSLVDVKKPEESTLASREFRFTYPGEAKGGFRVRDIDSPPHLFKKEFFDAMARRLSWQFTSHPTREHYRCE